MRSAGLIRREQANRQRVSYERNTRVPRDAFVVAFIGRLVPHKGLAELCDAWMTLRSDRPDLHLLIVGDFAAGSDSVRYDRKFQRRPSGAYDGALRKHAGAI